MAELAVIFTEDIPARLHSLQEGCGFRALAPAEQVSAEDLLEDQGTRVDLHSGAVVAAVFPSGDWKDVERYCVLSEFALSILTLEGHFAPRAVLQFVNGNCQKARFLANAVSRVPVTIVETADGPSTAAWLAACEKAAAKLTDHMHVTMTRYVRSARSPVAEDELLDLCISLESLLSAQTEISFRFSTCLTLASGIRGPAAKTAQKLLADLYDLRSKLVHGDPDAKKYLKTIRPKVPDLRQLARRILAAYVLFLQDKDRKQWAEHLKSGFFEADNEKTEVD